MILQALIDQLKQRLQHEKRAQVCLWFDEKEEFARLLPSLRTHLEAMKSPPFRVLEYDASKCHGQIWLKHQVHRTLDALPEGQRRHQRFLIYLPLSEDRLEQGGPDGEPALDMLAEYHIAGVTWRVGGKRPTLFSFLKPEVSGCPLITDDDGNIAVQGLTDILAKEPDLTAFISTGAFTQ